MWKVRNSNGQAEILNIFAWFSWENFKCLFLYLSGSVNKNISSLKFAPAYQRLKKTY